MNLENLPILIILVLSLLGNNSSVAIAATVLLLLKLLGLNMTLPYIEHHGIQIGITILTLAVLTPLVTGEITTQQIMSVFKNPSGLVAILIGIFVAYAGGLGVTTLQATPQIATSLIVGTIAGVCFFHGIAVGPLIAAGLVSMIFSLVQVIAK